MSRSIHAISWTLGFILLVFAASHLYAADSDKDKGKDKSTAKVAVFEISGSYPEGPEQEGLFGDISVSLNKILERIDEAKNDSKIAAILLQIRDPEIGRGKIDEFRAAIARVRKAGKKVYADVRDADSKPLSHRVGLRRDHHARKRHAGRLGRASGTHVLQGPVRQARHQGRDDAGRGVQGGGRAVHPQRHEPRVSQAVRAGHRQLLRSDGRSRSRDRKLDRGKIKDLIDVGITTAEAAKSAGLVDRIAYIDEFRKELAETLKVDEVTLVEDYGKKQVDTDFSGIGGFMKLMQTLMGGESQEKEGKNKKIAVVYAVGVIMDGESSGGLFDEATLGGDTLAKAIREADANSKVAAIVLRVDSPGGSALASDLVWREVVRAKKPIVASMGDTAASGGYYISMGAKKIVAERQTLTGSIGVVGGKVALEGPVRQARHQDRIDQPWQE